MTKLGLALVVLVAPMWGSDRDNPISGKYRPVALSKITVTTVNSAQARVSSATLKRAQAEAIKIFRQAGIDLVWCDGGADAPDLFLRVLPDATMVPGASDGILGLAHLSADGAGYIADVYVGRVEEQVAPAAVVQGAFSGHFAPSLRQSLALGVVMAHELGHLLLGLRGHASEGIMRAELNWKFFQEAYFGKHGFTRRQVKQLQENVRARRRALNKTQVQPPPGAE